MPSPHAAVRRLHVGGELALEQAKATARGAHGYPERRPRQHLTIGAIAQVDVVRIDLGFVAHVPAMARTLNLHRSLRSDCSLTRACLPAIDVSSPRPQALRLYGNALPEWLGEPD